MFKDQALISDSGIDYTSLRDLLAMVMWKEGDLKTSELMLEAMGKNDWWNVYPADINSFPCSDLQIIDQLWNEYSFGKFGFSVQRKIWLSVGGLIDVDFELGHKLGKKVGWINKGEWLEYEDLNFTLEAPLGHLPMRSDSLCWVWRGILLVRLFSRLKTCELSDSSPS